MSEKNNAFGISIIIPTYQEAENLPEIIKQITLLKNQLGPLELIIVDDNSNDGTQEYINQLNYSWVTLIIRKNKRGLSSAVIDGFSQAQYPILICMDADLSHPINVIPEMIKTIQQNNIDFVIGSRFISNGSVDNTWSIWRRLNAFIARLPARFLINIKDPLSGFFCLKKSTFTQCDKLNPIGYKIGLELMVKCHCHNIIEIPINFSERRKGKSKLTLKERINYLIHILRLLKYKHVSRNT